MPIKVECVIVCKDYDDFLVHTLPENLGQLDHVVVVTHPDDKNTQAICRHYGVKCVQTEVMHQHGDKFNKGRAINIGLNHLRHDGWVLHLDADCILPYGFKRLLSMAHLDNSHLYGADRLRVKGYRAWQDNKSMLIPHHKFGYLLTPHEAFPVGARLVHGDWGYMPIGYFQLWHSSVKREYPVIAGNAAHSDVVFATQWENHERVLIPTMFVYHLESDPGAYTGTNWEGRKTPHFGPIPCKSHNPKKEYCK
jgi:hypothetical protein